MEKVEKFKINKKTAKFVHFLYITIAVFTVVVSIAGIYIDKYDTPALQGTSKLLISILFFRNALNSYNKEKKSDTKLYFFTAMMWLFIAVVEYFEL